MAGGGHSVHTFDVATKVPKHPKYYLKVLPRWGPSVAGFGGFLGCMFLFFTDWKVFMDKVPIYNTKFNEREKIV